MAKVIYMMRKHRKLAIYLYFQFGEPNNVRIEILFDCHSGFFLKCPLQNQVPEKYSAKITLCEDAS